MSVFTYEDYLKEGANRAQNGSNFPKIGFFKLAKDGDQCLVRFNIHSQADLKLVRVHKPVFGKKFEGLSNPFAGISCFNGISQHSVETCPLCAAAAAGHPVINKAENVIFVQMLVSYKDPETNTFSETVPVVWERKASYAKELAAKLTTFGDLANFVFIMTRIGSGKDTRYTLDYIPQIYKPEMVPADFSAFENFQVNKHSYWEKSPEDINYYLVNGSFPEVKKEEASATTNITTATGAAPQATPTTATATATTAAPYAQPVTPAAPQAPVSPAYQAPVSPTYQTPVTPAQSYTVPEAPQAETPAGRPTRQFGGRF